MGDLKVGLVLRDPDESAAVNLEKLEYVLQGVLNLLVNLVKG
jgi:hypothetical protein